MSTDYTTRLKISLCGDETTKFFTRSGSHVATGYRRIVVGDRGPYIEFEEKNLMAEAFCSCIDTAHHYYIEIRTTVDWVKTYAQLRKVDYADYLPGMYYISPFDLHVNGEVVIDKLKR